MYQLIARKDTLRLLLRHYSYRRPPLLLDILTKGDTILKILDSIGF